MSQSLPIYDFCWLNPEDIRTINVHSTSFDGDTIYVFKVELKYSVELRDYHSDYSLAS